MADYSQEIQKLEAILNAATSSVSSDGASASIDLDAARRRLLELRQLDDASLAAATVRKATVTRLVLGGAW